MKPFPGEAKRSGKGGGRAYQLTGEQLEWFLHYFPIVENRRIRKAMHIGDGTMHRLAKKYGLVKSEKGLRGIRRRQARAGVKTCERNGYYDSIRGKKPPLAAREATRRRWDAVRRGEMKHPFVILRETNPKKYQEWVDSKRAARQELIRKEKLRVKYGLERHTKLGQVTLYPYTRSQVNHRFNALQRGYLVDEDCREGQPGRYVIYYNKDTVRSEKFEANCIKDGFRFEPD